MPLYWPKVWGLDFGIGHPFAAVLMTKDLDTGIHYVLHCIRVADMAAMHHVAMIRGIAPMVPCSWPKDGGDREQGSGEELQAFYKQRNGQPGLIMLQEHACLSNGSYSTVAGVQEVHNLMKTGKFLVSETCAQWWDEFHAYHWKDGKIVKLKDDLMSATRMAVMGMRYGKPVPLGPSEFGLTPNKVRREAREIDIFTGRPLE